MQGTCLKMSVREEKESRGFNWPIFQTVLFVLDERRDNGVFNDATGELWFAASPDRISTVSTYSPTWNSSAYRTIPWAQSQRVVSQRDYMDVVSLTTPFYYQKSLCQVQCGWFAWGKYAFKYLLNGLKGQYVTVDFCTSPSCCCRGWEVRGTIHCLSAEF